MESLGQRSDSLWQWAMSKRLYVFAADYFLLVFFYYLFIVLVSLFLRIVFDIKVSLDPLDFSSCPE